MERIGASAYLWACLCALSILVGLIHILLYAKFTPVYTATECGNITATLDNVTVGARKFHVGMLIEVTCRNPNPYRIQIVDTNPGRVWIGPSKQMQVGHLAVLPGSFLEEQGTGKVSVRMNSDVSGTDVDRLLPHLLMDTAVPVQMELQFNVGVYISFGVSSWGTKAPFKKDCALNMAGMLVNQRISADDDSQSKSRLGPLVCRESFGFDIPPVGQAGPADGQMGFSAAQVAPEEIKAGEQIKNISLGIVIFCSFSLAALFSYMAIKATFGVSVFAEMSLATMCHNGTTAVEEQTRALVPTVEELLEAGKHREVGDNIPREESNTPTKYDLQYNLNDVFDPFPLSRDVSLHSAHSTSAKNLSARSQLAGTPSSPQKASVTLSRQSTSTPTDGLLPVLLDQSGNAEVFKAAPVLAQASSARSRSRVDARSGSGAASQFRPCALTDGHDHLARTGEAVDDSMTPKSKASRSCSRPLVADVGGSTEVAPRSNLIKAAI